MFHEKINIIWWYLSLPSNQYGTTLTHFKYLPKIAEIVLTIPHIIAELERLFSIVQKHKINKGQTSNLIVHYFE